MSVRSYSPSSRQRLTTYDLARFPSDSLFDRLARAVCRAGCLPRKELFESWEVARRSRRLFRGGRVVDLAAGHGLLALAMLLLDDSSPLAVAVDTTEPPSHGRVVDAVVSSWPRLAGRISFERSGVETVPLDAGDVVVSSHACGGLSDVVLDRAIEARARLALLPCCHDLTACDAGGLSGWLDGALAVDVVRAQRLRGHGYRVWTQAIPAAITPKNRLLLAAPEAAQ
jgi:Methyltransferase domain